MRRVSAEYVVLVAIFLCGCAQGAHSNPEPAVENTNARSASSPGAVAEGLQKAIFAGGCFWCVDAAYEDLDGVTQIISGFTGGHTKNPTYEQVGKGETGHLEAIQVVYNPKVISYSELLDVYWRQIDPTDAQGSFHDRGSEYVSAIFYYDQSQKTLAEKSRDLLAKSGVFGRPIVTKILKFEVFYPAENYHQHYCKTQPDNYHQYRNASGRDDYIKKTWGKLGLEPFRKPAAAELKKTLTLLQYEVTQRAGTEPAFKNEYCNNEKEGIYVDVISGEPLFSSRDKFDSGTGWPSFTKPIDPRLLLKKVDRSPGAVGVEVRGKRSDSHLGHSFDDGPAPTHLRYCMNSAALRFIPKDRLQQEGYANFAWMFIR